MVNDDEQLVLDFEQARDRFYNFVFVSTTVAVGIVAWPLGFLVPFGPMEARTLYCFLIVVLTFLLSRYLRALYSRWVAMDKARTRRQIYIADRSQQTTIVAEPVHIPSY